MYTRISMFYVRVVCKNKSKDAQTKKRIKIRLKQDIWKLARHPGLNHVYFNRNIQGSVLMAF